MVSVDIRVHSMRDRVLEEGDVYIGRDPSPRGVFGNPFVVDKDRPREEAIKLYRQHLEDSLSDSDSPLSIAYHQLLERLVLGETLNLVCWCKPLPCHGDVLAEFLINDWAEVNKIIVNEATKKALKALSS